MFTARHTVIRTELELDLESNLLNLISVLKIGQLKLKRKVYSLVNIAKIQINILESLSELHYQKASCQKLWMEVIHVLL